MTNYEPRQIKLFGLPFKDRFAKKLNFFIIELFNNNNSKKTIKKIHQSETRRFSGIAN